VFPRPIGSEVHQPVVARKSSYTTPSSTTAYSKTTRHTTLWCLFLNASSALVCCLPTCLLPRPALPHRVGGAQYDRVSSRGGGQHTLYRRCQSHSNRQQRLTLSSVILLDTSPPPFLGPSAFVSSKMPVVSHGSLGGAQHGWCRPYRASRTVS